MTIWRKGMLAVCVHTKPRRGLTYPGLERLQKGSVYRVVDVGEDWDGTFLGLEEVRSDAPFGRFWHGRFRPAVQDNQRCEEEFITLLKRSITQPTGGDTLSVPAADCMGTLSHTLHAVGLPLQAQAKE